MNFIQEVMDSTAELESPRNFWYWSALACISAVVMDNVWLPRGEMEGSDATFYNTYPNIYVMLHAESGLKKGPPVALAKNLVRKACPHMPRIISGRSSIQGMLKEMGTSYSLPGGKIVNKSAAFIASSEFTSSIVEDRAAMTILTDLYDRNWNEDDWKSLLKMEQFTLKDPVLTLLVATNEAHFDDFIVLKDVHGGFIGRMFVIAERETANFNPLIEKLKRVPDKAKLADWLRNLSALKGPFQSLAGTSAGKFYHEWYMDFYNTIRTQRIRDDTGTIQRFGESVLKVAMLLSMSQSPELVIDMPTMVEAVKQCETLIGNVRRTTMGKKGAATNLQLKNLMIEELLNRDPHAISKDVAMKKFWMHYNVTEDFVALIGALFDAGTITIENWGNTVMYVMNDKQVEELKAWHAAKKGQG